MTDDVELTDEEKELLASADTDTAVEKDKPAPSPEQPKVEQPKPEQPKSAAVDESKRKPRRANREAGDDDAPASASAGPYPGHPFAPPAQMDYGDPWGLLPVQMRHDADGNPVA